MHDFDRYRRFAVFYTCAPDTALARFGASWLGWDSATGKAVPRLDTSQLDLAAITTGPQKYGFHGTLKAPFRLKDGANGGHLLDGFVRVCEGLGTCPLDNLKLARLGRFLALVPEGGGEELQKFSGQIVQGLDSLRATLTEEETARRNPARLTPRQAASLAQWGYPFVMQDFRFHMTLTDRLSKPACTLAERVLGEHLESIAVPDHIDALTLMGEDASGHFHQLKRITLD